ncbi:glycosyltransferase family 20-domain-containing protein [Pelagophyceae sp. CCMP2097]|nr:glycosyltransferase family 20-domain-containing protein [Pelagophyceae sp. CCMP2097]
MDQALSNFRQVTVGRETIWVGCPDITVSNAGDQRALRERLLRERRYAPVFIDAKKERLFYSGFCKRVLWPLFHSSPPTTEDTVQRASQPRVRIPRAAYVSTNQAFADVVRDVAHEDDLIWVQDYHFMLLPQMLRALNPSAKLGFFLHVPFPSSELYRMLPFREEILHGLLAADLLGFQTYDYARHFLSSCEMVLGIETSPDRIEHDGHVTRVCVCPVGIEPDQVRARASSPGAVAAMARLEHQLQGRSLMLGVDTLDPTKGLVHKFLAVEELFSNHPELADQLVFAQVVLKGGSTDDVTAPGATGQTASPAEVPPERSLHAPVALPPTVLSGAQARRQAHSGSELFSTLERQLHAMLIALFSLADVLVVTPIRDGMNVIPFEYLVARDQNAKLATVLLSEFAGCARSLGGAVLINPWDTSRFSSLMARDVERRRAHEHMLQYVCAFTATGWASRFLDQLQEASETKATRTLCRELTAKQLVAPYSKTKRRLIVFALEGVLVPPTALSELLVVPPQAVEDVRCMCRDARNRMVLIISPRSVDALERVFAPLLHQGEEPTALVLAAEEGLCVKWSPGGPWEMQVSAFDLDLSWDDDAAPLIDYYTERTPGAVIERKASGIVWHYRDCDLNHGAWQARQLQVALGELAKHVPLSVFCGDKCIEVRPMRLSVPNVLEQALRRLRDFDARQVAEQV